MKFLIKFALHPASSALFFAVAMYALLHGAFFWRVLTSFVFSMVYVIVGPRIKRNARLWKALATPKHPARVAEGTRLAEHNSPNIIVSFPVANTTILQHALAFGSSVHFEQSTVLYVCESRQGSSVFLLPVARVALWLLGGLMRYSRSLLLQLLKRKANFVAIVLEPPVSRAPDGTFYVTLKNKGLFAAAIKSKATVVPAVVSGDGSIDFGNAISAADSIPVPTPDDVRALSTAFGTELAALFANVTKKELTVRQ